MLSIEKAQRINGKVGCFGTEETMQALLAPLRELAEYDRVRDALTKGRKGFKKYL